MILRSIIRLRFAAVAAVALSSACTSTDRGAPPRERPPAPQAALSPLSTPSTPSVLDGAGACTGPAPTSAGTIEPGIGECDLVRLKGRPPTDVLVGEGRSGREVQVLYNEPGAKELYFFVNNKLDRIVKS